MMAHELKEKLAQFPDNLPVEIVFMEIYDGIEISKPLVLVTKPLSLMFDSGGVLYLRATQETFKQRPVEAPTSTA